MSFLHTTPAEFRAPVAEVLPDGRKRLTRMFKVAQVGVLPPELAFDWGSEDGFASAPAGWTGLRLIGRNFRDAQRVMAAENGSDITAIVELVYEQIAATAETAVGGRLTTKLEDGRTALEDNFIQFSANAYGPQTVGTSTATGDTNAFLLKEESVDDGTVRRIKRTYVYAGKLRESTFRRGTLLGKTLVYIKTVPPTPSGYVLVSDQQVENPNGVPIYTYTFYALADAGYSVERYVSFTYPGRATAFSETYGTRTHMDILKSPPVTAQVVATIAVAYQTDNTLGTISDLWNPLDWATARAQWISFGNNPHNLVESLPGYRAVGGPAEETCSNVAPISLSIFGNPVYGDTSAKITVSGGPENPAGNTYTLDAFIDEQPAFVAADGTKYYRKTTVTATIPAQPALPV